MTPTEAIAYLTPHEHTADTASISLTAGKMREAVGVLKESFDALDNIVIAYGMGWDLDGFMEAGHGLVSPPPAPGAPK